MPITWDELDNTLLLLRLKINFVVNL